MNVSDISVLIGGEAGDGINQAGVLIARLFSHAGLFVSMYYDYPSLIRGGHNFSVIRAADKKISACRKPLNCILAVNQDTVDVHKHRLLREDAVIFDSEVVESAGRGLPLSRIVKEEGGSRIMRNSVLIGALAKAVGIEYDIAERVLRRHTSKKTDVNVALARRGYEEAEEIERLEVSQRKPLPVLTGNQTAGLGLVKAGLDAYVAYPMTPSSSLLHFLAGAAQDFGLTVIHPENEIAVILAALGFSCTGRRVAVGTSGGGFCLMTESLSLAGMAELPVVVFVSQRAGPSTGIPTYTAQADLRFILSAGHGEFVRFVTAPGDVEEACFWSGAALNLAWAYQIPSIVLSDKNLSEGAFSFEAGGAADFPEAEVSLWDRQGSYERYRMTDTGVSPLAFPGDPDATVKVNSYEHDEYGLTTEQPEAVVPMYDKRLRKEAALAEALEAYETVQTHGHEGASTALLCWGSTKSVCAEVAQRLGLKVIRPLVLAPFPVQRLRDALNGVEQLIDVEHNATAQLARVMREYGFSVDAAVLKYDGRPFTVEELEERIREEMS